MRSDHESLKKRAQALKLHGLIAHWSEVVEAEWLPQLIEWEVVKRLGL